MAGNPQPQQYPCYFMISPSPQECPNGLRDIHLAPNPPVGGWGPMFYVKFGDGNWHNNRYTTHNPTFTPGDTDLCANIPGAAPAGARYYLPPGGGAAVNPGTYLEQAILQGRFAQNMNGEWYRIHAPAGVTAQQLATDLMWISDQLDNPGLNLDFGYQAALAAHNNPGQATLQAQQQAATAVMQIRATAILQRLQARGYN
ncbi:hypothetical protein QBC47DRAFT_418736 [Echria macrotheca]|uniref:Uncharacterized protein n=1 Tax=Echria macrotheca TaxID=438768 RepID=A0AAJ0B3T6_9PEZI|nr:hypothetical protein QBC47DRAFT_418736 [Echria macrotheca]